MSSMNENNIIANPFPSRSKLDELMSMFKAFDILDSLGDSEEQIVIPFPTSEKDSDSTKQIEKKVA